MHTDHARLTSSSSHAPPLSSPLASAATISSRNGVSQAAKTLGPVATPGGLVEPAQHQPPCIGIARHVGVAKAVQASRGQLVVDHLGHRDARVGVLGGGDVAEGAQRRLLLRH